MTIKSIGKSIGNIGKCLLKNANLQTYVPFKYKGLEYFEAAVRNKRFKLNLPSAITLEREKLVFKFTKELKGTRLDPREILKSFRLAVELNKCMPERPVQNIIFINEDDGFYFSDIHTMTVNPLILTDLAHEMGHAAYHAFSVHYDENWKKIHCMLLACGINRTLNEYFGDGYSVINLSPTETFADLFSIYVTDPQMFIDKIADKETTSEAGKLIWCYMRDHVFKGKYFLDKDPFKMDKVIITETELKNAILKALTSSSPLIRYVGVTTFKRHVRIADKEFMSSLIRIMEDKDVQVRAETIKAIQALSISAIKDAGLRRPLIIALCRALYSEMCWDIRTEAAAALGKLGAAEAEEILKYALKDTDVYVRGAAAQALINIDALRQIGALEDIPSKNHISIDSLTY